MMRLLIVLAVLLAPTAVLAQRQCAVTGNVTIDSSDSYYCDTTWGNNCAGWCEVSLDTVSQPMRFLAVEIGDGNGTTWLGKTHTLSNGSFSRTVLMPGNDPCAGRAFRLAVDMRRVHEDDLNVATPRYRFKVTRSILNNEIDSYTYGSDRTLTGDTTVANWHFARVPLGSPETESSAVANLYYMTNSMLTQAVTWEPFIGFKFESTNEAAGGIYRIRFVGGCAPLEGWGVHVNNIAGNGMLMRRELGHSVHQAIHGKQTQFANCTSPNYGGSIGRDPPCQRNVRQVPPGNRCRRRGPTSHRPRSGRHRHGILPTLASWRRRRAWKELVTRGSTDPRLHPGQRGRDSVVQIQLPN